MSNRPLFEYERPTVAYLFGLAGMAADLDDLVVCPMADGGMGSLAIAPFNTYRRFGASAAECHFYDLDGVLVLVSLDLDDGGRPFEIDVWRVDYGPVSTWPEHGKLKAAGP